MTRSAGCSHSSPLESTKVKPVARLPEPVAGRSNSVAAFRSLLHPGSVLEWDALEVLEAIVAEGGTPEWAGWMRDKYLLGKA